MDWERLINNKARSGAFTGCGAKDEDAYYAAFAGGEKRASLSQMLATARQAVAEVGAVARSAIQTR